MADELWVTSSDGTSLRTFQQGSGPSIVFVHGTLAAAPDWLEVARLLSGRFHTVVFDRRGRGGSGDGDRYSIDCEVDDIVAVASGCGAPACVVGHSFGAIVAALAAARHPSAFRSLVVYEPPIDAGGGDGSVLADELDDLVGCGRLDDAVTRFVTVATGSSSHLDDVDPSVRSALRDAVVTAGREVRAASQVLADGPTWAGRITVPTMVLLGIDQHDATYSGIEDFAGRLPNGQLERVPGGHLANLFAPGAVADQIATFVDSSHAYRSS